MNHFPAKAAAGLALLSLAGSATPALAGAKTRVHARRHSTVSTSTAPARETALTGTDLTTAENNAVAANPGATAKSASTETDSTITGAAYEVHIVKSDGTRAVVIEDASFTVLQTTADHGPGGHGPGNGETPLTGTDLSTAEANAVAANSGATAEGASTETDSTLSGAKYEVHIKQADGSQAVVIEDANFAVLATQAAPAQPPHGDRGGRGPGGHDGPDAPPAGSTGSAA